MTDSLSDVFERSILLVEDGLEYDQTGDVTKALPCYTEALVIIDSCLAGTISETSEGYRERLRELRKQILVRMADIEADKLQQQHQTQAVEKSDKEVIAFSHDRVELFRISNTGSVEREPGTTQLQLLVLNLQGDKSGSFVRVGDWILPLVPGTSSVWCNESGSFVFPALEGSAEQGYIGISFPADCEDARSMFEEKLRGILTVPADTVLVTQPSVKPTGEASAAEGSSPSTSQLIAGGLEYGGQAVGTGLVYAAEFASEWIIRGGSWLRTRLSRTIEPTPIDPRLQTGVNVARGVSGVAYKVTEFVADQVGTATVAASRYLAPHVRQHGTALVARMSGSSTDQAASQVDTALVITGGALCGASNLLHGLDTAGKILAASVASSTVNMVQHTHGNQAAALTNSSMMTLLNLVETGKTVSGLGPRGVVKKLAKSTGKAVVGV